MTGPDQFSANLTLATKFDSLGKMIDIFCY